MNNYRFNGKEFQADLGLNWNHQDWRFLDPQLLRWHAVDPEVENGQESWTPYSFGYNNAVRYADADGREPGDGDGFWRRAADFATGVRDAINSNNTTLSLPTGSYSLIHASAIPSPSYSAGQTTGNVLSFGQGVVQMLAGGTTAAGGTAGGVVTAPTGVGAVAGYAVAAVGVAVHGHSTASNAARNLFSDNNGCVNASSSNSNSQGKRKFGNKDRAEGFEKSRGGNDTPKCEYCDGELHPDKGHNNSYEADHRDSYAKGGKSE